MDKEEIENKLKLIEILLIISGILLAIKQFSANLMLNQLFIFSILFQIIYYVIVSNRAFQFSRKAFIFITFMTSIFFSASLGTVIGIISIGTFLSQGTIAILYYLTFTLFLFLALSSQKMIKTVVQKMRSVSKALNSVFSINFSMLGRFLKKYGYTAGWIAIILTIIIGIPTLYRIYFMWSGNPYVVITNEGSCLNITDTFKNLLSLRCNEMDVQQNLNLTEDDFSDLLNLAQGATLSVKMNKGDVDICTAFVRCSYTFIVSDTLTIHDCMSYCVTRVNGTTECHSDC